MLCAFFFFENRHKNTYYVPLQKSHDKNRAWSHKSAEVNRVDPPMFPGFFLYEKEPGYEYGSTQDVCRNDRFRSQPCTAEACSGKTYPIL